VSIVLSLFAELNIFSPVICRFSLALQTQVAEFLFLPYDFRSQVIALRSGITGKLMVDLATLSAVLYFKVY
jgi:hypothetical protein